MLVLHSSPDSASMAPRIVIEDLGLTYSARVVDRAGGELASAGYRAMHPLGKIPVLETPDRPMFETAAILLWLADTHAPGRLAPAPGSAERGAFLTWFFFTSTNLHPNVLDLFYADRVAGLEAAGLFATSQSLCLSRWSEAFTGSQDEDAFLASIRPEHVACLIQSTIAMSPEARRKLFERAADRCRD